MRSMRSLFWDIHDRAIYNKMDRLERKRARWQTEGKAAWNARLPPVRISEEDSLDVGKLADMSSQRQSPFFTKLPLELQRLIYTYAFSGKQLQLKIIGGKKDKSAPFRLQCLAAQRLLAFPKSCKMAYLEAAHMIYTSNTFQIPSITAFFCFQRLLATKFFQAIQLIHLRWADPEVHDIRTFLDDLPPHNISSWRQTCQEISKMKGLKRVRIDMVMYNIDPCALWVDANWEILLFSPLEAVQGLEEIEVCATWGGEDQPLRPNKGKVWAFPVRRGMKNLA